jgi:hypothetical protein
MTHPTVRTSRPHRGLPRHRVLAAALAAALALGVSACAGSGDSGSSSSAAQARGAADASGGGQIASAPGDAAKKAASGGSSEADAKAGTSAGSSASTALLQRRQIRTGELAVQVKDVSAAVSSARAFATGAKGFVADEQTSTRPVSDPGDGQGPGASPSMVPAVVVDRSVLTLRVPQQSLDQVMEQVGGLGAVQSRTQASQDVTDQYVDTSSRVKSQRASVDRVRTLLHRATSIGDVVSLESELSRREADLESLEARLAALDDSTTLATLVVSLSRPETAGPAPVTHHGLVAGLLDGWHALGQSTAVALQIVGALLPFAVLLALVGLPVWLLLRRRRPGSPAPSA